MLALPEIDLTDPAVLNDPFTAYAPARERSPLARLRAPGMPPMWGVLRHVEARAMLADPARFALSPASYAFRLEVSDELRPYLHTVQEMEGAKHVRLRKLVAPAFTARRAAEFRPRIERIVDELLDDLAEHAADGPADLLTRVAHPLPMAVMCELVGIPAEDRPRWRGYGAAISAGAGAVFAAAFPEIIRDAEAAVEARRREPLDDIVSDLVRIHDEDGDRLTDVELVALVWLLVLAGQTPSNLIANSVEALLAHPDQLAALRADPGLAPRAVEELIRWCSPQLLTIPRLAAQDGELAGVPIAKGDLVTAVLPAVNRDPRVFADPDTLDITRTGAASHLGFAHGPHFCLGAAFARIQTQVALTALLRRAPGLALAVPQEEVRRAPDGGTWRPAALPVTL
ncbi:cytochrome P450 [Pseudonocardia cypriaca]|uniref:Cytochrome P450 n=1 Tax=Pseudonocardia cypriaca TaxID=882449 RepID=A0A543FV87_9PSEU|nr:cytochrome P450 [Pseudonocardia cypriaca]TQM37729.1 cytochrome P450 [Pseudonocardia cypriaca]